MPCRLLHQTWQIYPPQSSIDALHTIIPNLADLPPIEASSGEEWQFKISIVKAHIGRSAWQIYPLVEASSGKEWQFKISVVKGHIGRSSGRSAWQIYPSPIYPDEVFYAKDLLPARVSI